MRDWFMTFDLAEREGFEPSVPFSTHAFQACSIDHSDISPYNTKKQNGGANISQHLTYSIFLLQMTEGGELTA